MPESIAIKKFLPSESIPIMDIARLQKKKKTAV
jgi:hypothetical protein